MDCFASLAMTVGRAAHSTQTRHPRATVLLLSLEVREARLEGSTARMQQLGRASFEARSARTSSDNSKTVARG